MDRISSFAARAGCASALTLLMSFLPSTPALAQYAYPMGGSSFDSGVDIGLDAAGNTYVIGEFRGDIDFDPGSDEHLLNGLNDDVFIVSYDAGGLFRFAFKIAGNMASHEMAGGIAVQPGGDFVVTGSQPFGTVDYDPDPDSTVSRSGLLFVAGYTGEGALRYVVTPGGGEPFSSGIGNDVALDAQGNAYVTGAFITSLGFDPESDSTGVVSNQGAQDVFIASYDPNGRHRFSFGLGDTGHDVGNAIAVDAAGNLYVTGYFSDDVAFDPNDSNQDGDRETRTAQGASDRFLASYSASGRFRFAYTYPHFGPVNYREGFAVAADRMGRIYLAGTIEGTIAFDPENADGDGDRAERTGGSNGSGFLAGYTTDGLLRFAHVLEGGMSRLRDVAADSAGVLFVTGTYSGDVDLDPGPGDVLFSSRRGADVLVASYDADGAFRHAYALPSNGLATGRAVAFDPLNNTAVTGGYTVDIDLDPDMGTDLHLAAGQDDIFIARYPARQNTSVAVEESGTPDRFQTSAPFPNPFSVRTAFALDVDRPAPVRIAVFDVLGRAVDRLYDGTLPVGRHAFEWNGDQAPAGIYLIRIEAGDDTEVLLVVRLR